MASTVSELREELEGIAVIFDAVENPHKAAELAGVEFNPLGTAGEITYRTTLGPARFRLRMVATPDAIRERAERLGKQARDVARMSRPGKPRGPTVGRGRFSTKLYQKFIDDGEPDNAEAYKQLFE